MNKLHPNALFLRHLYYWECRLNGMTAILAGPFADAETAEKCGNIVGPICVEQQPETRKATFGVMRVNVPGCGLGKYNEILPDDIRGELMIDLDFREGDPTN